MKPEPFYQRCPPTLVNTCTSMTDCIRYRRTCVLKMRTSANRKSLYFILRHPLFQNIRKEKNADGKETEMDAAVIEYSGFFIDLYFYDRSAGKRGEGIVF